LPQASTPLTGSSITSGTSPSGFTGAGLTTGGTGTGSGTASGKSGSSWSDPSHWTNQPGQQLGPGSVIKDRFILEEAIGRGGMGIVFKARDQRKEEAQDRNPYVAIKVLNEEFKRHPESLKALQREARKAQKLAHPNIVTVFDFDRDGANVYMVMELLEGESLDRLIKASDGAGVGVKDALKTAKALCAGLAYAHEQGVVHSDFKPANAYRTNEGVIKVFDFGIARAARRTGDVKGETTLFDAGTLGALTPAYASCEMIEGLDPDARDDIYALACVVYELLTGRHPFNKVSAVQARDTRQVPKRPAHISSRQWKGLMRGLAFDREQRSPSIEQFLYEITPQRRSQPLYIGAAAAVVAIVIGAAMFLPGYFEKRRIRGLIEAVTAGDAGTIEQTLPQIAQLPPESRAGVLVEVRPALIDYGRKQIGAVFDPAKYRYDYAAAQAIIQKLLQLDADSRSLFEISESLKTQRDEAISDQSDRFDEYLRKGWLIAAQNAQNESNNINAVLAIMRKLDPNHALLKDPRLGLAYGEQAQAALVSGNVALAQALVTEGAAFAPDDSRLRDLRDEVTRRAGAAQRQMRVAELRRSIDAGLGAAPTLAGFDARRAELDELKSIAPGDPALRRAQQALQRNLDREIQALAAKRSIAPAQELLARYAGLADATYVESKRSELTNIDTEFRERLAGLTDALNAAVRDGRLEAPAPNNAMAILAQLQAAGVDAVRLTSARDQIAQGYATRAGETRSSGKWDDARRLVDRGLQLQPTQSVIDVLRSERLEIDQAERVAKSTADVQQRHVLLAQRQAEDKKLLGQLADGLKVPRLNVENARRLLQLSDNLERRQVKDPLVTNARRDIQAKLLAEIEAVRDQDRIDDAIRLAEAATGLMPSTPTLQKALTDLRTLSAQRVNMQRDATIADLKRRVDTLLRTPKLDDKWEAELAGQFDKLAAYIPSNDPFVVGARQRAASAFVSQAKQWRAQERFSEAERMLQRAERYTPDTAELTSERQLLAAERTKKEASNVEQRRLADLNALKQKLLTRARAEEISEAIDLLKELKKILPATDSFLTKEGPAAISNAYVTLASKAGRRGDFDGAANLVTQAIEYGAGRSDLAGLRDRYLKLGQIDKSLKTDARINVAQVRQQLNTIKAQDQAGFASIEQGLAAGLVRRVNTVRARDPALSDQLARTAHELFPNAQGLPAIAIASEKTPTQVAATPAPAPPPPAADATPTPAPASTTPDVRQVSTTETTDNRLAMANNQATRIQPQSGGALCRTELAGFGRRGARGICYDMTAGGRGPEMVVVPAGPLGEPFAISRFEITIGDYANYCRQSNECNPGGGQQDLPITAISAANAERYASWLTRTTGAQYRLPSESEWTYAAGAQGAASDGENTNCIVEVGGNRMRGGSLLAVRSGNANGWGLFNAVGNAQEFAKSGSGWVVRGGMYNDTIGQCTVSLSRPTSGAADTTTGFRLVRSLGGASS